MWKVDRVWCAVFLLLLLVSNPAVVSASTVAEPQGKIILTVTGTATSLSHGSVFKFDMALLENLPRHVVKTANPWRDEVSVYEGVLLRDLLYAVGTTGSVMNVRALDDYHEDIEIADVQSIDVILAYKRDGLYMPVRDKGPLFVVFPFTDDPSLLTAARRSQSVWQVNRIVIK